MPHYADGTEAKVGDQVTGKLYNTPGVRAGTIISITPGVESCNAQVQFTETVELGEDDGDKVDVSKAPRMAACDAERKTLVRFARGEAHGSAGPRFALFTCVDYTETKNLTKVG